MAHTSVSKMSDNYHPLLNDWVYWCHLPQEKDWSIKGYINICTMSTVEDVLTISDVVSEGLIKYGMLFIMKKGINPTWEDPNNCDGGCFSYKILNSEVVQVWKLLTYSLTGEVLLKENNKITGITISPKKNFCIIKIWMSDCRNQNPNVINYFKGINAHRCLFKKFK